MINTEKLKAQMMIETKEYAENWFYDVVVVNDALDEWRDPETGGAPADNVVFQRLANANNPAWYSDADFSVFIENCTDAGAISGEMTEDERDWLYEEWLKTDGPAMDIFCGLLCEAIEAANAGNSHDRCK